MGQRFLLRDLLIACVHTPTLPSFSSHARAPRPHAPALPRSCLIVATIFTILLAGSLEHPLDAGPPSSNTGAFRALIKSRSAAEANDRRGLLGRDGAGQRRPVPGPGAKPAPAPAPVAAAAPGQFPQRFVPLISASKTPAPETEALFDLRNCECVLDGKTYTGRVKGMPALGRAPAKCTCREACPADVNIGYLTEAVGQDVCSLRRFTGYGCTAGCFGPDKCVGGGALLSYSFLHPSPQISQPHPPPQPTLTRALALQACFLVWPLVRASGRGAEGRDSAVR